MARSIAVLKLPTRVKYVVSFAESVASALAGNPHFPSPTPTLATFRSDLAALDAAEAATLSRTKGSVEARDARLAILRTDLATLRAYVQTVAERAAPGDADVIIASAGLRLRKPRVYAKPLLAAKQGPVTGAVHLAAKAPSKRASYIWQYSTDQTAWTAAPQTMKARAELAGLTAGTRYFFRFHAVTKAGVGDWSQTVALLVL
jgi:hypothetical protein